MKPVLGGNCVLYRNILTHGWLDWALNHSGTISTVHEGFSILPFMAGLLPFSAFCIFSFAVCTRLRCRLCCILLKFVVKVDTFVCTRGRTKGCFYCIIPFYLYPPYFCYIFYLYPPYFCYTFYLYPPYFCYRFYLYVPCICYTPCFYFYLLYIWSISTILFKNTFYFYPPYFCFSFYL